MALSAFLSLLPSVALAADELVMFQLKGCPHCYAWDHEIGPVYAKTDEGKLLPLRRVEITDPRPADLVSIAGVRYTPTFIVMHCGHEVTRIVGYAGSEQFWMLMDEAVEAVKSAPACNK